ncbi:MAG: CCA tRNA nucleotidyltransferase [Symbiobacteriia bacterium]
MGGILSALVAAGHDAVLVGGAPRDLLLGRPVRDWDVATSATSAEVAALFPHHHRLGAQHELILVVAGDLPVEISRYRTEPPTLAGDLAHRDFTIDAMAWSPRRGLVDTQGGRWDLALGRIRACGSAAARLREDPLRALRGVRLAAELGFRIEGVTWGAIRKAASGLASVAPERIRAEWERILLSPRPAWGMELLRRAGLLAVFAPELLEGVGCRQNQYHRYDVWSHSLLALANTPPEPGLRLAALLHDIGKPRCVSEDERGRHFYAHEQVGEEMARDLLTRLHFDGATMSRVPHLVRYHMDLHFDLQQTDASVRRLVRRLGAEHMEDLLWLRRADRIASGTKQGDLDAGTIALLERIRRLAAAERSFAVRDLAIGGRELMAELGRPPGPWLGKVLRDLRDEVAAGDLVNSADTLRQRARELAQNLIARDLPK